MPARAPPQELPAKSRCWHGSTADAVVAKTGRRIAARFLLVNPRCHINPGHVGDSEASAYDRRNRIYCMKRLSFLISLTNNDNDYQQEQAALAEKTARRLGVDVKIVHANNDALLQSQQLLHYVQDSSVARPDAIIFEPAGGTAFPLVARAATAA